MNRPCSHRGLYREGISTGHEAPFKEGGCLASPPLGFSLDFHVEQLQEGREGPHLIEQEAVVPGPV